MKNVTLILLLVFLSCKEQDTLNFNSLNLDIPLEINLHEITSGEDNSKKKKSILKVEDLSVIPLETSKDCPIKKIMRTRFTDKNIFVQNHFSDILMFDRDGAFIRKIGTKGRGPGEYRTIFSFDIHNESIIILDGYRLIFYDFNGKHYKTIESFKQSKVFADEFCYFNDDNYYLWVSDPVGRVNDIKETSTDKFDHFYKIKKGKVDASYIEGITTVNTKERISKIDGEYVLSPTRFDNFIYSIKENGLFKKYRIDFTNKLDLNNYKIGLNDDIIDYNNERLKSSGDYSFYRSFFASTKYCYFEYAYKGQICATLWDKTNKDGINWIFNKKRLFIDNQIPFVVSGYDKFTDCFVLNMFPNSYLTYFESTGGGFSESNIMTSEIVSTLNSLGEYSNPVLFFFKM